MYWSFLRHFCNPRTGKGFWVWVQLSGILLMLCCVAFAFPYAAWKLHIDWVGHISRQGNDLALVCYNGLFNIPGEKMPYYLIVIVISAVVIRIGHLAAIIGNNYKKGFIFIAPHVWVKAL